MALFESAFDVIFQVAAPMWVELTFMLTFSLGFALVRSEWITRSRKVQKSKDFHDDEEDSRPVLPHYKQLEADIEAGQKDAALETWHLAKASAPAPPMLLKTVVQIFLETKPDELKKELNQHFTAHRHVLGNAKTVAAILDVVARASRVDLLDELAQEFQQQFAIQHNYQTYEVLIGGHAAAGNECRVRELFAELHKIGQKPTARAYSLTIKGFLKNGLVHAVLPPMQAMHQQGFFVPAFAVAQFFRAASQDGKTVELLEAYLQNLQLPQEALVVLLEDCVKRTDLPLALRIEKIARQDKTTLPGSAYASLLKICVLQGNSHAFQVFQTMQDEGFHITEGLLVGLLTRCAESKFLRFAEDLVSLARSKSAMTLAVYSALMKCYAYCGMYDKACDLYSQILADGLEPDAVMYGCLMKFSVECGRTELSQELFSKAPALDIQNYMSLIRAAGRDKDVDRAFAVLEKLKSSGAPVDIAAYNCVLDVCVSAGDMKRARALMADMQNISKLDKITFNTLLKGHCSQGDLLGAKIVLTMMSQAGLDPDDVSYNCLINAAVSSGKFAEAWSTIELMERNGVPVDHYTISIMMKSLKRTKDRRDVDRAMELLENSGVDVCSDEVLLNAVLEVCSRHRQLHRLENTVSAFMKSKLRPSVHTYGSLIKACSTLKRLDKCRKLWDCMVDQYAIQPNDIVLGCMLDALVCHGDVEDAVSLLGAWKSTVTPNTVMYSTIVKGFATSRQASRALDMWKEMCELKLPLNVVVYNALIDSQARVGAMDEVTKLVESMEPNGCSPDAITYSTIVKGYCVQGDVDKAFDIFRTMQKDGMAVDSVIYNVVMDGCTRQSRFDLVDLALDDMNKFNITPTNFTIGILVKMYGRRKQLDKAFKVADDLSKRHNIRLNMQVRTCLMSACLNNNDLESALQVFGELKFNEGGADANAYGSLISGCVRQGHLEKAAQLVEDAYGLGNTSRRRGLLAGQVLSNETLEQLMRALGQRQLMRPVGAPLLEKMRVARLPLNGKLLAASVQAGRGN